LRAIPKPVGSAITLSPFRRPTAECAPVGAKAALPPDLGARSIPTGSAPLVMAA